MMKNAFRGGTGREGRRIWPLAGDLSEQGKVSGLGRRGDRTPFAGPPRGYERRWLSLKKGREESRAYGLIEKGRGKARAERLKPTKPA